MRAGPKAMVNPPTSPPPRKAREAVVKAPVVEVPEELPEESSAAGDFDDVAATVANDVPPSPIVEPVVPAAAAASSDSWPDLKQPHFEPPDVGTSAEAKADLPEDSGPKETPVESEESSAAAPAVSASNQEEDSSDELSLEIGSPVVAPTPAPKDKAPVAAVAASGRPSTASLVDIQAKLDKQTGQPSPLVKFFAMLIGGCIVMMVGLPPSSSSRERSHQTLKLRRRYRQGILSLSSRSQRSRRSRSLPRPNHQRAQRWKLQTEAVEAVLVRETQSGRTVAESPQVARRRSQN